MSGPQVKWELVGDATKSHTAIDSVDKKAQGLTSRLQGVGKGMVIGAGIGAFNLLTGAIDMGIGKLGEARQAFMDDQLSQEKMAQSLKNNIPNWDGNTAGAETFAAAAEKVGFEDDAVRDSLGRFVGVTHDLAEAQQLSSLAMDLARAKGIDLASATDIVSKAHEGNGKALKGLSIDIGGAKTAAELLDAIQKNVKGSAEAWAQTSTGVTAVSQVKVGEAMEKLGGIVDRVATVALPILADAFTVVIDVISNVVDAISPLIAEITRQLEPVIKELGPVAKQIFGGIEAAVRAILPVFQTVFGVISTIIKTGVSIWQAEMGIFQTVVGRLGDVFRGVATIVEKVFGTIGGFIKGGINAVIGAVNAVIRAINGVQLHINLHPPIGPGIDFDWNGMGIRQLAYLHQGGVVPGVTGSDVLAVLQAGERVTPIGSGGGDTIVNVYVPEGSFISGPAIDELTNLIVQRLRQAPGT